VAITGLGGAVSYLIARVSGPHLPVWPFGVFAGMVVAGGVLYAAGQWHMNPAAGRWLVPRPPEGFADRAELGSVVRALTASGGGPVVLTTGLVGAGGFGKTTLAARACHDRAVRRRFRAGVWVTVGRDADGATLAARISEAVRQLGGDPAGFTGLEEAGRALAAALSRIPGPVLLVADDVWTQAQLEPFLAAGNAARLLVTTRRPAVLGGTGAQRVKVDQVSAAVAERMLARGLPPVPAAQVRELADLAGGWPLLLNLVNRRIADDVNRGAAVTTAAADAAARLRRGGPAALDLADSGRRETAAAATIGYSLDLLGAQGRDRFLELGIFAEDSEVPVAAAALLWHGTAGLDEADALALCERMDSLSLLSLAWSGDARVITLHDVIRDYARSELGPPRLAELNRVLVDAAAADLPPAGPLAGTEGGPAVAWWEQGVDAHHRPGVVGRYLSGHLVWHLREAGRIAAAEALACDLRWAGMRLASADPAAVAADLSLAGTERAARMRVPLGRAAYLLARTVPETAVVDILHSRLAGDPDWGVQVAALRDGCGRPRLVNRWPLPDLPQSALRAVLEGHQGFIYAVCPVTADGRHLLASGGLDGTVRIWDPATGEQARILQGHQDTVSAVCPVTAGSRDLLASVGDDGTVRIWDPATGEQARILQGHQDTVSAVCPVTVAGRHLLASGGADRTVRIWDPATGEQARILQGHQDTVSAVCPVTVAGRHLLASGGLDGTVRIWDPATGEQARILQGHQGPVNAVCPVTADGQDLLASGGADRTVRIWDPATGEQARVLQGHQDGVSALCPVTADGQDLLASGGADRTVRIWDPATGEQARILQSHRKWVLAVCPVTVAGRHLLASGGLDGTVRVWDPATGEHSRALQGHQDTVLAVCPVTVAGRHPLASGGLDQTVRIWDPATGEQARILQGHQGPVSAVCPVTVAGRHLLASGGLDQTVRIWDPATGEQARILQGHQGPVNAVCPVTTGARHLLASGGDDGAVRIWDPATGEQARILQGHQGPVNAVCPVTTGTRHLLASGGDDGAVRIWDPATGEQARILQGHQGPVFAVCPVTVAGRHLLASGGDDGAVRIWDPATGEQARILQGHQGPVFAVCPVTVAGRHLLASGGTDQTVRVWDPATGEQARALMRVDGPLHACAQIGAKGLAAGGALGLYVFDYLP